MRRRRWPGKQGIHTSFFPCWRRRKRTRWRPGTSGRGGLTRGWPHERELNELKGLNKLNELNPSCGNSDERNYHMRTKNILARLEVSNIVSRLVTGLALASAVILTSGCRRSAAHQPPPPPAVTVAPVEHRDVVEWDEFTGRIEPVESVAVRPRVSGYVQEVRFQSGQLVKKGEVRLVLDPGWPQPEFD